MEVMLHTFTLNCYFDVPQIDQSRQPVNTPCNCPSRRSQNSPFSVLRRSNTNTNSEGWTFRVLPARTNRRNYSPRLPLLQRPCSNVSEVTVTCTGLYRFLMGMQGGLSRHCIRCSHMYIRFQIISKFGLISVDAKHDQTHRAMALWDSCSKGVYYFRIQLKFIYHLHRYSANLDRYLSIWSLGILYESHGQCIPWTKGAILLTVSRALGLHGNDPSGEILNPTMSGGAALFTCVGASIVGLLNLGSWGMMEVDG